MTARERELLNALKALATAAEKVLANAPIEEILEWPHDKAAQGPSLGFVTAGRKQKLILAVQRAREVAGQK